MENDYARFGNLKNFNLFFNSFKARENDRQVVINQFVPPTFCFCICFTGINSRGMLDHVYDVFMTKTGVDQSELVNVGAQID